MSIPHLKARAEFYTLCLEHGPENVEWVSGHAGYPLTWDIGISKASDFDPSWREENTYAFRLRPRTVTIPEAVVPEEDPEGAYVLSICLGRWQDRDISLVHQARYRTAEDRDAVVAAMMKREVRR